jgi:hypothetical protein
MKLKELVKSIREQGYSVHVFRAPYHCITLRISMVVGNELCTYMYCFPRKHLQEHPEMVLHRKDHILFEMHQAITRRLMMYEMV